MRRDRRSTRWLGGAAAAVGLMLAVAFGLWALGEPARTAGKADGDRTSAGASVRPSASSRPENPGKIAVSPLHGPWIVAVQAGHWGIGELPSELRRLRGDTGAVYGSVREVDINRAVAEALVARVDALGWRGILVPATVPPALRADAFIAIHADSASDGSRRGWKLSPPWRASADSRALAAALRESFAAEPDLREDVDGVTVNMRGYYAFNPRRFDHTVSPYTPATIIELGFLSNAADRAFLTGPPDFWAAIILRGLEGYFASFDRENSAALRPLELPWVAVGAGGAIVRAAPSSEAEARWSLDPGTVVLPVDLSGAWYEVFVRRSFATGWVLRSAVVETQDPHWPMPGEKRYDSPGR